MRRLLLNLLKILRHVAVWFGWLLGLSVVVLFIGFVWATATQSGSRWLMDQAEQRLPVSVGTVQGNLWQGLSLTDLNWHPTDGPQLKVHKASVNLGWQLFWQFELQVQTLHLSGVRIVLPASSSTAAEPQQVGWPDIEIPVPVPVRFESMVVDDLTVLSEGQKTPAWVLSHLQAQAEARDHRLSLVLHDLRLATGTADSALKLQAQGSVRMGLTSGNPMEADLAILVDTPQGWVDSVWTAQGPLANLKAGGQVNWIGFDGMTANATLQARVQPTGLDFQHLAIDGLGGVLCGQGRVTWQDGVQARLQGNARGLKPADWLMKGADLPASGPTRFAWSLEADAPPGDAAPSAKLALTGLNGNVAGVAFDQLHLTAQLQGDALTARIDQGQILGGAVDAGLSLGLTGQQPIEAKVSLGQARIAPLLAFLPSAETEAFGGTLSMQTVLSGRLGAVPSDRQLKLAVPSLTGTVTQSGRTQPLNGALTAQLNGENQWQLDKAQLHLGSARLDFTGRYDQAGTSSGRERVQLSGRLQAPKLTDLPWSWLGLPVIQGRAGGAVDLRGTLGQPELKLDLSVRGLRVPTSAEAIRMDQAKLTVRTTPDTTALQRTGLHLRLEGQGWQLPGLPQEITNLTLSSDGRLDEQQTNLDVAMDEDRLLLRLKGGWQPGAANGSDPLGRWQGDLTQLRFVQAHQKPLLLEKSASLLLSPTQQKLGEACLTQGSSRLCLQAEHGRSSRLQAHGDIALELLRPWLPPDLNLPGRGMLKADLTLKDGAAPADATGSVHVQLPDSAIELHGADEVQRFAYRGVVLNGRLRGGQLALDLAGQLGQNMMAVKGQGTVGLAGKHPLALSINVMIPDLSAIAPLLAQFTDAVTQPEGRLDAQVSVGGTVARPTFGGRVQGDRLAFAVPDTGVSYRDGQISAQIDSASQLRFKGSLRGAPIDGDLNKAEKAKNTAADHVNHGLLHVEGSADLAVLPKWRLSATIQGTSVPVLALPNMTAWASPDLKLKADQAGADIRGTVLVPRVQAHVEKLPANAVAPSDDVVIVGQTPRVKPKRYPVSVNVRVRLGDDVRLSGMGFSTRLGGGLRLQQKPGNPLTAFGEIDLIDGKYRAYGQDLTVKNGRLVFAGPIDDPGLAVTASRKISDTEVGLRIGGTLNNPKTEIYSSPSMPESEALSLLLTGRRLNDSNATDGALLLAAINGLGIDQGENLARDIGQKLGFDEIGLDSGGTAPEGSADKGSGLSTTRLTLGKRIGNRLFVRYAIGVLSGVGELITQYKLNKFLDLEVTASPEAQGGDLIYRIEQGKPKQESSGK